MRPLSEESYGRNIEGQMPVGKSEIGAFAAETSEALLSDGAGLG
jgi:hypothetical protein